MLYLPKISKLDFCGSPTNQNWQARCVCVCIYLYIQHWLRGLWGQFINTILQSHWWEFWIIKIIFLYFIFSRLWCECNLLDRTIISNSNKGCKLISCIAHITGDISMIRKTQHDEGKKVCQTKRAKRYRYINVIGDPSLEQKT